MQLKKIYETFQKPGVEWRGKPFWSWNGELKSEELIRQADILGKMGFGGYFMHSRCGLITEYLGDEWFQVTNDVADFSEKTGLEAWLYDEDRWPSGSAGGKVTEDPSLRQKALYLYESDPEGFTFDADVLFAFAATVMEDGISIAGYREVHAGDDLSAAFAGLGEGTPKMLSFKVVYDAPDSTYNGNTYIDTMKPAAVDRFIELTHEQYRARCGDRLGNSVKGIFTDEPLRGFAMSNLKEENGVRSVSIFYTDDIFEEFLARYGYDARPRLPEIFYRLGGEPVSPVRIDYFDLGSNLFDERFMARVNAWCEENNMVFTGHVLHEDSLTFQAVPNGSLMRNYLNMGMPGVDLLGNSNNAYWTVKQLSSVCRQFGKKWMLSELYGCTGWEFSFRDHKAVGNWQALFGINVRCPHLSWYTMEGECKRDYPASISFQSPYWKDYELVETYFARLGVLLAEGDPVCDTLVLNPIESAWGIANLAWADWIMPVRDDIKELEKQYNRTFRQLAGARVDFDYGEEQIMARYGRVEGGRLHIGKGSYRRVVISGTMTVRPSTLALLRELIAAGGEIIFVDELPGYVGGVPSDEVRALKDEANVRCISLAELGNTLAADDCCPIRANAGDKVYAQTRRVGDTYISMWLNCDRENTERFTLSADLPAGWQAQIWDAETGIRYAHPAKELSFEVELAPSEMLCLVFTPQAEALPERECRSAKVSGVLSEGEFAYTLEEPNVCVLDYARYTLDGEPEMSELMEILKLDRHLRDRIGMERRGGLMLQPWFAKKLYSEVRGRVRVEYPFRVETLPAGKVWLAAERPEFGTYSVNGQPLSYASLDDWWVDNAFIRMEIPEGVLKIGENTVTLEVDYRQITNLEAVYLLGDFGVRAEAGASALIPAAKTVSLGDMAARELPFYSGRVTVEIPPEAYLSKVDAAAERIYVQIPEFSGALVTVGYGDTECRIAWEPWTAEITEAVKKKLPLRVTLVNSRRNSFGPLHILPVRRTSYGPDSFTTGGKGWQDAYSLVEAKIGDITFLCE